MNTIFNQEQLSRTVTLALDEANKQGADQVEAMVSGSDGVSVSVRLGKVESLEKDRSQSMGITIYKNGAKGSSTTTDLSDIAVRSAVRSACSIASFTQSDDCAGLADVELMAIDYPYLDLYHPWSIETSEAIELVQRCESAARNYDSRIINSEGANLSSHEGVSVYGNSHGFLGCHTGTRHSLSCSVIASEGEDKQRDYWSSCSRNADSLTDVESIGRIAAQRSVERLQPRQVKTQVASVLYTPEIACSLLGHFISAIRGTSLYRKTSFLLDKKGEQLFPEFFQLQERPHILSALGSAAYDNEGVATQQRELVQDGVLVDYVLDSYSARKLGLQTTANANGVHNLELQPGSQNFDELIKTMHKGLLLTEMMGSGVNGITGDYSRGAVGFWVENGEIQYPVDEITVAGNLLDMFKNIVAIGSDMKTDSNIRTGSILLADMTIAGA